jgi:hypothetical protein
MTSPVRGATLGAVGVGVGDSAGAVVAGAELVVAVEPPVEHAPSTRTETANADTDPARTPKRRRGCLE